MFLTEEERDEYLAIPKDEASKTYAIWKELDEEAVLIPRDKLEYVSDAEAFEEGTIQLRHYQEEPVAKAVDTLRKVGNLFLKAPCGTGKTVMSLAICERLAYKKVVILVDQKKLADQWEERIKEFLPTSTCAVFHSARTPIDKFPDSEAQFDIVVAQSLMTKDWATTPVRCDLVICDEAHVFSAPCFCASMYNLDYGASMALTATDERRDGLKWVFMKFLATNTVTVKGTTMMAKVIRPKVRTETARWENFQTRFCVEQHKLTWYDKCTKCELFNLFPACGALKRGPGAGGVEWNKDKTMWTPMLMALFDDPRYLDLFEDIILKFHAAGRQVLVFNQFVSPLKVMLKRLKVHIPDDVAIFTSGVKKVDEALAKPITLTTYKIAEKGLDVPFKDAAILMSPTTQIEQVVGRITRVKDGKKRPIVFDPVITNNVLFARQAQTRLKQYKSLGFET